jgi:hypothetical protein
MAAAGDERDALLRALAADMMDASGRPGFIRAERPRDLARALGRGRRRQPLKRSASAA